MRFKFRKRKYKLKKGLTRKEAFLAVLKKTTSDFRGMQYNPKTGNVTII